MIITDEITKIIDDIKTIKIQGATAVAEATFKGITIYLRGYTVPVLGEGGSTVSFKGTTELSTFLRDVERIGLELASARPNEPLARNGLKYLVNMHKIRYPSENSVEETREHLLEIMEEFLTLLAKAKDRIVEVGVNNFGGFEGILTHCHSTTVERVCQEIHTKKNGKSFSVVATETRPLYQGRKTAADLLASGLDVKLIVDSAVTSFLAGDWDIPVNAVLVGCDEIAVNGDTVNKVGSYGVALSAYYASKPVYVVGTLLKLDPSTIYSRPRIEMRSRKEVWEEAPDGLVIINPAFELIPAEFIAGFLTEFGIIKPSDVERELSRHYDWLW